MTQLDICLNPSVPQEDIPRLSRQCVRLLDRLSVGPMTNVEAVTELRILNLTGRVSELRQAGYDVKAPRGAEGVWTYTLAVRP
jgi:hypothetical protein